MQCLINLNGFICCISGHMNAILYFCSFFFFFTPNIHKLIPIFQQYIYIYIIIAYILTSVQVPITLHHFVYHSKNCSEKDCNQKRLQKNTI